jgi:hypothetical protein
MMSDMMIKVKINAQTAAKTISSLINLSFISIR